MLFNDFNFIKNSNALCVFNVLEKNSLEAKNKKMLENLQSEKMLSASLKKESFHWQSLYHESTITSNSYKVKALK